MKIYQTNGKQFSETNKEFYKNLLLEMDAYVENTLRGFVYWTRQVEDDDEEYGIDWDDMDRDTIAESLDENFSISVTAEEITIESSMRDTHGIKCVVPNNGCCTVIEVSDEAYEKIQKLQELTGKKVQLI